MFDTLPLLYRAGRIEPLLGQSAGAAAEAKWMLPFEMLIQAFHQE